ncbi:hypothetical protein MTO96_027582 [Rhipicephalus appendiculatus]
MQRFDSGRQVTSLGLRFTVRPSHFVHDEMRIKCTGDASERRQGSALHVFLFAGRRLLGEGVCAGQQPPVVWTPRPGTLRRRC